MRGKLIILALGVGVGYLLGSRAGREPYEKFSQVTKAVWEDPRVQRQVDRTVEFANDKFEDAAEIVSTGTRNIIHRLTAPKPSSSTRSKPSKAVAKRGTPGTAGAGGG